MIHFSGTPAERPAAHFPQSTDQFSRDPAGTSESTFFPFQIGFSPLRRFEIRRRIEHVDGAGGEGEGDADLVGESDGDLLQAAVFEFKVSLRHARDIGDDSVSPSFPELRPGPEQDMVAKGRASAGLVYRFGVIVGQRRPSFFHWQVSPMKESMLRFWAVVRGLEG